MNKEEFMSYADFDRDTQWRLDIMSKFCAKRGCKTRILLALHEKGEVDRSEMVDAAAKGYGIARDTVERDIGTLNRSDVIEDREEKIALTEKGKELVVDAIEFLRLHEDIADWTT
jgi:Mn-dependent DtxR family transcriptional regulator